MKTIPAARPSAPRILATLLCWGLGVYLVPAQGVQPPKTSPTNQASAATQTTPPTKKIRYRPPNVGTSPVRLTGGSRGTGADAVVLDVLAPADVGTTTQDQPSLFWYQSKPANARFELTLLQEKQVKPLVQIQIDRASQAGIQRLKLSEHGAKLVPGVEYQWVVALVTDPENRSTDLVASGAIKRIEPGAELAGKIKQADRAARPDIYAEAGIWYDTLSALADQIEANPGDQSLVETRRDLLRQVGLKAAAGF